jgi:hypothetical protein
MVDAMNGWHGSSGRLARFNELSIEFAAAIKR